MSRTAQDILVDADRLSPEDRSWLAQQLQHPPGDGSTEAELDAAWGDEIKRRLDEIDSGKVQLIPGELVVERMFAKITDHRNPR